MSRYQRPEREISPHRSFDGRECNTLTSARRRFDGRIIYSNGIIMHNGIQLNFNPESGEDE